MNVVKRRNKKSAIIKYIIEIIAFKLSNRKVPFITLSVASLILLILTLVYFRFDNNFSPDTKYSPPKMENGKIKPAENN